jgi:hypothetical protein
LAANSIGTTGIEETVRKIQLWATFRDYLPRQKLRGTKDQPPPRGSSRGKQGRINDGFAMLNHYPIQGFSITSNLLGYLAKYFRSVLLFASIFLSRNITADRNKISTSAAVLTPFAMALTTLGGSSIGDPPHLLCPPLRLHRLLPIRRRCSR